MLRLEVGGDGGGERVNDSVPRVFESFEADDSNYRLIGHLLGGAIYAYPTVPQREDGTHFLRLVGSAGTGGIVFERSPEQVFGRVSIEFDYRATPIAGRGGGLGFGWLDAAEWGDAAAAPRLPTPESPSLDRALTVGIDLFRNDDQGDPSDNHVSLNFDEATIGQYALPRSSLDLGGSEWIHVSLILESNDAGTSASLTLALAGGVLVHVFDGVVVPGFSPFAGRLWLAARAGGDHADVAEYIDLDNASLVLANPIDQPPAIIEFQQSTFSVVESDRDAFLLLQRGGTLSSDATVRYSVASLTAVAGRDFTGITGQVLFSNGERWKVIRVPVTADDVSEGPLQFTVKLTDPSDKTVLGEVASATVTIWDDDEPAVTGMWDSVFDMPVVPVHAVYLPTDEILIWDRNGDTFRWSIDDMSFTHVLKKDPENPTVDLFNAFCSGHLLLEDGSLFVAGGHVEKQHPEDHEGGDGVGVDETALYDPFRGTWLKGARMNGNRWYPSLALLLDGSVLAVSGSKDTEFTVNRIPQIYDPDSNQWRDVGGAEKYLPLYPWMYATGEQEVVVIGPEAMAYSIDTAASGSISEIAESNFGERNYGTAAAFSKGQFLVAGGNPPRHGKEFPTRTAERLDLSTSSWSDAGQMHFGRRQVTSTVLPDGQVLVTGGHSSPGFNDASAPVYAAELWDPETNSWTMLAGMRNKRLYHSVAMLLPDGRVFVGGGGQPPAENGGQDQRDGEFFSPPYLFRSARPQITKAPFAVDRDKPFLIETPDAANISAVSIVSLPAVTHDMNQSQRFAKREITNGARRTDAIEVSAIVAEEGWPNGFYMVFALSNDGVPSEAAILQVTNVIGDGDRHNVGDPQDVDASGEVIPLDALLVINSLNCAPESSSCSIEDNGDLLDVSGDGQVTAYDAWLVVDRLNGVQGSFERGGSRPVLSAEQAAVGGQTVRAGLDQMLLEGSGLVPWGSPTSYVGESFPASDPGLMEPKRHIRSAAGLVAIVVPVQTNRPAFRNVGSRGPSMSLAINEAKLAAVDETWARVGATTLAGGLGQKHASV